MAMGGYGALPAHVDQDAEEARRELLAAIEAANPAAIHEPLPPTGDARSEVLAALQRQFPPGASHEDSAPPSYMQNFMQSAQHISSFPFQSVPAESSVQITEVPEAQTTDATAPESAAKPAASFLAAAAAVAAAKAAARAPSPEGTDVADSPEVTEDADSQKAEDTDKKKDEVEAEDDKKKKDEKLQEGLDRLTYLSKKPTEAKCAWIVSKAEQLRREGNKLFSEGTMGWRAAAIKYRSVLDLLGEREVFPESVQKTHDDLTVLCSSNLAACAIKAEDFEESLRLCGIVLTLDPGHIKARFRRALSLIRRSQKPTPAEEGEELQKTDEDDGGEEWPPWQGYTPSSGSQAKAPLSDEATRAAELLEAQREIEVASVSCPKDKMVSESVEELFARALYEKVRLRPPNFLMPKGLRDFDYLHAREAPKTDDAASSGPLAAVSGGPDVPGRERNLLIFLHGFGGRKDSFIELAEQLKLPRTAVMVLNAPSELPDELLDDPPGFSWFTLLDDNFESIEPTPKEKRRRKSLEKVAEKFGELLNMLVTMCGWSADEIFLFGYGQGGTVALEMSLRSGLGCSLGGIIGVATCLLPERKDKTDKNEADEPDAASSSKLPAVLLIHGDRDPQTQPAKALETAELLKARAEGSSRVQLEIFAGRGGEMLRGGDEAETRLFMKFLADNLHGVGRKGSAEAMRRLGAEPVEFSDITVEEVSDVPAVSREVLDSSFAELD